LNVKGFEIHCTYNKEYEHKKCGAYSVKYHKIKLAYHVTYHHVTIYYSTYFYNAFLNKK